MASLLVCIDDQTLQRLAARRLPGQPWRISAQDLNIPQLALLDEDSTLFLVTLEGSTVRVVAVVENEVAEEIRQDITPLLYRLGYVETDPPVKDLAAWASSPRVLALEEVDVLRYQLRLGVTSVPASPEEVMDDAMSRSLRDAVWRDPHADEPRMIYADYLLGRGDPRGDLIALQLQRARTGEAVSERERQLLVGYAHDCVRPLERYLEPGYELARGFLVKCTVTSVELPEAIVAHPAWSTVESLTTSDPRLAESPALRSLRRLACEVVHLAPIAARHEMAALEVVVGRPDPGRAGLHLGVLPRALDRHHDPSASPKIIDVGALRQLRVLSLQEPRPERVVQVVEGQLGAQLRQLHVITRLGQQDPSIREAFERSRLPLLTLRWVSTAEASDVLVAFERTVSGVRLVVELSATLAWIHATALRNELARLGRGIREVEVRDLTDPSRVVERHQGLIMLLEETFPVVRVLDTAVASLEPKLDG